MTTITMNGIPAAAIVPLSMVTDQGPGGMTRHADGMHYDRGRRAADALTAAWRERLVAAVDPQLPAHRDRRHHLGDAKG